MKTNYELVLAFHDAFNLPIDADVYTKSLFDLREDLIREEWDEVIEELDYAHGNGIGGEVKPDLPKLVKELTDLLVVTYGFLAVLGVDADHAFRKVMESNMSKLDDFGKPVFRDDGKVLKGPNYRPVNESELVKEVHV